MANTRPVEVTKSLQYIIIWLPLVVLWSVAILADFVENAAILVESSGFNTANDKFPVLVVHQHKSIVSVVVASFYWRVLQVAFPLDLCASAVISEDGWVIASRVG